MIVTETGKVFEDGIELVPFPNRKNGYLYVKTSQGIKAVHRLMGIYFLKVSDDEVIDHIDQDKHNNNLSNLRKSTTQLNGFNRGKNSNNTSGVKGVTWDASRGKWKAQLKFNSKNLFLGRFTDLAEAKAAYDKKLDEIKEELSK